MSNEIHIKALRIIAAMRDPDGSGEFDTDDDDRADIHRSGQIRGQDRCAQIAEEALKGSGLTVADTHQWPAEWSE